MFELPNFKNKRKKCIFNEQKLKELQIKLIEYSVLNRKVKLDFYQIRFLFQDIDFCLKIFLYLINLNYFNEAFWKIVNSLLSIQIDKRINNYINYESSNMKDLTDQYKEFDDQKMKTLNNSLKIKNTLIVGQKPFHDFIKDLKLPTNTFCLTIEQLVGFCDNFKDNKIDNKYVINKYFIIINYQFFLLIIINRLIYNLLLLEYFLC